MVRNLVALALGFVALGCSAKPLARVEEVALMDGVACARTTDGAVSCWGRNLGPKAISIPGFRGARRIVAAQSLACVLGADGRVGCVETRGQGRPDPTPAELVVKDQGWEGIEQLVGSTGIYARAGRKLYSRGAHSARIGAGDAAGAVVTDLPEDGMSVVAARGSVWVVSASGRMSRLDPQIHESDPLVDDVEQTVSTDNGAFGCVRRRTGATWCAGSFGLPFASKNLESHRAREVPELRDFEDIVGGPAHLCARRRTEIWCAGANDFGQLGDGSTVADRPALAPVALSGPARQVQVSVPAADLGGPAPLHPRQGLNERAFACAVLADGSVECWGYGHQGQLGDGAKVPRARPVKVVTR